MSTNNNYGEILCTAIDEIISKRFEDLSYDISKVCTIVDDSSKKNGKYVVSDGSVRFEAFSTETDLSKGNSVMVTIPNGDYNLQKTITGRIAADDTTPFVYTSPLDNMIQITNNIFDSDDAIRNEGSLLANDVAVGSTTVGTSTTPLYSIKATNGEFAGYTRLGVSADFKSWLADLGVVEGTYGIVILAYYHDLIAPGQMSETAKVRQYYFSSLDMIGNPYYFDSYFGQEKVFDISDINNIEQIDVYFFQSGNFKDTDGNLVPYKTYDTITQREEKLPNNLFVDNVSIVLGYSIDAFEGETLLLSTPNGLSYHYSDAAANTKNILLRWIHKIDDTHYEMLDGNSLPIGYEIRWFRHCPGYSPPEGKELDEFAGKDWEPLDEVYKVTSPLKSGYDSYNPCKLTFIPNTKKQQELVRAIGIITTSINEPTGATDDAGNQQMEVKTQVTHYNCKENLKLENEEYVPDPASVDAATALQIVCEDGSEGNYFLYNQNGKIINEGEGQGKKRYFKALYQGLELTSNLGKLDFIEWWMPVELTMLVAPNEYYTENAGVLNKEDLHYHSVDYWTSTRKVKNKELASTKMAYSIGNQWGHERANNTIRCRASINGTVYEATAELRFGKAGTNGTNQTFLIEFEDNENGLTINDLPLDQQLQAQQIAKDNLDKALEDASVTPEQLESYKQAYENSKLKQVTVRARLYDGNGSRVDFTEAQASTIQWSWHKYTDLGSTTDDAKYIILSSNTTGASQVLTCRINTIPADNYYILKATYGKLETYLPIPLKTKNVSFIEGAREVIYNHQGNPNYYSDPYILYYKDDNNDYQQAPPADIQWNLTYDETINVTDAQTEMSPGVMSINRTLNESYIPKLRLLTSRGDGYKGLSASPMYASGFNDKVCVYTNNTDYGWSQPILIMQSRYDFAMLNEWDGTLKMDEENGTIMATMLGAGRKNPDNTFSGVLIGDLAGGSDLQDTEKLTGVYGLHEGEFSFALKEDGRAFFGKKGRGQIHIDGNTGTIKSHSYDVDNNGMLIDLDDGIIDIKGPHCNFTYEEIATDDRTQEELDEGLYFVLVEGDYKKISGKKDEYKDVTLYKLISSTQASFYVSPFGTVEQPYLNIDSMKGNSLIHISDNGYYLQSDNWIGEDSIYGTHFNLNYGNLDVRSSIGKVYISGGYDADGNTSPYFQIAVPSGENIVNYYDKNLFYVDGQSYYLRSKEYGMPGVKMVKDGSNVYNTYNAILTTETIQGAGDKQEVKVGTTNLLVTVIDDNIYTLGDFDFIDSDKPVEGYYSLGNLLNFDSYTGWDKHYNIKSDDKDGKVTITADATFNRDKALRRFKNTFTLNYYETVSQYIPGTGDDANNGKFNVIIGENSVEKNKENLPEGYNNVKEWYDDYLRIINNKGFQLDLKNNRIDGYDLSLRGINSEGRGSFSLDSGAVETPFTIGNNFKVSWDGTLNCNKINSLNNDGNTGKVISVNNNFYVSKSGGAGGSGCRFGGSFAGYCSGIGAFSEIKVKGETGTIAGAFVVGGGSEESDGGSGDSGEGTTGTSMSLSAMVSKITALEDFMKTFVQSYNSTAHTHEDYNFYRISNASGYESIDFTEDAGDPSHSHLVHVVWTTVAATPEKLDSDLEFKPGGEDSNTSTDS